MQVDDKVKENLFIVATILAILNNGTQLIGKSLKATKWVARKIKTAITKKKTHPNRQPSKPKRKR